MSQPEKKPINHIIAAFLQAYDAGLLSRTDLFRLKAVVVKVLKKQATVRRASQET